MTDQLTFAKWRETQLKNPLFRDLYEQEKVNRRNLRSLRERCRQEGRMPEYLFDIWLPEDMVAYILLLEEEQQ